jgi:hypothetical protein
MVERLGFSVIDAAKALGVRVWHLRCAIQRGELTPHAIGVRSVLLKSDLEAWVRSRPATPKKSKTKSGDRHAEH